MSEFDFDRHDRYHEEPRDHAEDCDICEARFEERKANGEYDDIVVVPAPGTLGIGVGIQHEPILERGETMEQAFHSIVWFPADQRAEADEFAAHSDGWVVREGVAL